MKTKHLFLEHNFSFIFIIFLSLLLFTIKVSATNYYVSASGNDNADGLTPTTPWLSIDNINAEFYSFPAGSTIYFNRGDTFYGSLLIGKSGTSGNPITLSAYGTGAKPVITGFVTIPSTSWVAEPGLTGVYSTSSIVTTSILTNMVTIDGKQVAMGRYPDTGFLTYESTNGTNTITDNQLGTTTNWKGAGMALRKNDWTLDRASISNHVGNVLTYSNLGTTQSPTAGFGYFIMNDLRTLTSYGEWYHSPAQKKFYMYFGTVDPTTKVVKVANVNDLITNISSYDYITVDNLNLTGAINNGVNFTTGNDYCTVQNCEISFIGNYGILIGGGKYRNVDNNTIRDCNSHGVFDNYGSFAKITNNTITDIAVIPGQSYYVQGNSGIYMPGNGGIISYNTVRRTGYTAIGIKYAGAATVSYNYIDSVCLVLNDGGGIYMCNPNTSTRLIDHNIITNVIGNGDGAIRKTSLSEGIYLDEYSSNVIVTNNSLINIGNSGIKLHKATNNIISDNTTYNCGFGFGLLNSTSVAVNWNLLIKRNIFVAKTSTQYAVNFASNYNDISFLGVADSNYYARPSDDNKTIAITLPGSWSQNTLATWQTITKQDVNTQKSPIKITSYEDMLYHINPTNSTKTIVLNDRFLGLDAKIYQGTIDLKPYSSIILLKNNIASVNDIAENMSLIKIYPNPTHKELTIEVNKNIGNQIFEIFNTTGQIIYKGNVSNKTTIDIENFHSGIYFIKINHDNSSEITKFIKL